MAFIGSTDVQIDVEKVYRRLGYGELKPMSSTISLVNSMLEQAYELLKPCFTYRLAAIREVKDQNTYLENSVTFFSKTVSYVMTDCQYVVAYLATIGRGLEEQVSALTRDGKMLEGVILDATGSEAIIQTARVVQQAIKQIAQSMDLRATIKYSPGYCDWDVSQQAELFKLVDASTVCVSLTPGCMMVPQKSVSGIIGLGKLDERRAPPCTAICDRKAICTHKRAQWDPEVQSML
jgi:hypothetical protein